MHILIAPDSFKGSLRAEQAANALAEGFRACRLPPWHGARITTVPLADGGEGTARTLVHATGGRLVEAWVLGPLLKPVKARFGILGDGTTAVVEMAEASGLTLIPERLRDPRRTSSWGTGQLIVKALDYGCEHLIVAIGGSATNDGGAGMAQALGVRLLDAAGRPIPPGGARLKSLARIDMTHLDPRLSRVKITVACDVDNPLLGPNGATRVFAPQKGADPAMVEELEEAMSHYAEVMRREIGVDVTKMPGAGAAGGLGAALMAFCGAVLRPGFSIVSEAVGLREKLREATLVVTGEGRIDGQTRHGKVVAGVGKMAKELGVPVVAVAGSVAPDAAGLVPDVLDAIFPILPGPASLADAMYHAEALLKSAGLRMAQILSVGARLR